MTDEYRSKASIEGAESIKLIATMSEEEWKTFIKRTKQFMELFA